MGGGDGDFLNVSHTHTPFCAGLFQTDIWALCVPPSPRGGLIFQAMTGAWFRGGCVVVEGRGGLYGTILYKIADVGMANDNDS
jgi:hypothetical protein